ncbi:hypothetical protein OHC33_007036 [Knufia fluminis]|uniref:Uncharacterized protein n=1 Tax=Knufia fluminis TaxID=191047 RepID=A0AAN8EBU3_9EURO|nr:hypothetical protein OHC33_007036 [Knufia fluminis]
MAAEAQAEVQALLGFLTRDAKLPLAAALPKYNLMRTHGLTTPDAIAKSDVGILKSIFNDEKIVKQVHNAAKRLSNPKKRAASTTLPAPSKHLKSTEDKEAQLALPQIDSSIDEIRTRTIESNRAPLFLAFAFTLTKFTLPDQPLSSRLSLAQAVTSAGAQSKAKWIGLADSTAEDEGWAEGQPKVKIMGREIAVMRRHIAVPAEPETQDSDKTVEEDAKTTSHEAFWGIDLEALRKSNGPLAAGKMAGNAGPPIHKPEAARAYLLKSIDLVEPDDDANGHEDVAKTEKPSSPAKSKKMTVAEKTARREQAVAMLLKSLEHVCASWASTLTHDELDRRASSWYAKVRPEVEGGQAGWGQRGKVPLRAIVDLAKDS